MSTGIFEACGQVNSLLIAGHETEARNALIRLLDRTKSEENPYGPLVNRLIRQTGLYPYLQIDSASWEERFVFEAFKVDIGGAAPITLHREQSALLRKLVDGENLAISAPTSFGKSFVIDAFIAIRKPQNVVIIVPTLALTDETRRRLHRKFAGTYKVITTPRVSLAERNILVFPQERAQGYVDQLEKIDLLVIDEFYKASATFDRDRSPSLLSAILKLQSRAIQRYFLAPNISTLNDSPFTKDMTFQRLDFNTVYLEQHHLYQEIQKDVVRKSRSLVEILTTRIGKTLVYAGTYSNIDKIAALIVEEVPIVSSKILADFSSWLAKHYDPNWVLVSLATRAAGIHNGQLHRSLSQIQVRLFEEEGGLRILVSTSSIVEGVNTSAENVVLWSNRKGLPRLDDFTYKNIMGRGGRMFRHFVGQMFILEAPPDPADAQLELEVPEQLFGEIDERELGSVLTEEQVARIVEYKVSMRELLGADVAQRLEKSPNLQTSNWTLIREIARDMMEQPHAWDQLRNLTFFDPQYWDNILYRVIRLQPSGWDTEYRKFVGFIKALSRNWERTIPELLDDLDELDIGLNAFFKLERNASFKLATLLNDVYVIAQEIRGEQVPDITGFIGRLSKAFLPPLVYELEEYGLPRMISRKIQKSGIVDLESTDTPLHDVLETMLGFGYEGLERRVDGLDEFDRYILAYFYEGITPITNQVGQSVQGVSTKI